MVRREHITRRRVSSLIGSGLLVGVAGCADDEDDAEDDDETDPDANGEGEGSEDDEEPTLVVHLEDEDGDAVSDGIVVEIIDNDEGHRYVVDEEIEDGVAEPEVIETGSYTVVAEGDEYESAEEELTLEEGDDEEITLELETSS